MKFSTVDSRPISLALVAGGQWLNWSKSASVPTWESPFVAANHLLACTPDATFATFQQATIPDSAVCQADCLITFTGGKPISCSEAVAPNLYLGPWPGVGVLR